MRIISDFHDYYDGVQRTIYNGSIIYKRKTVVTGNPRTYFWGRSFNSINIYFCGFQYFGCAIVDGNHIDERKLCSKYFYSSDKFEEFVTNNHPELKKMYTGYRNNLERFKKLEQKVQVEDLNLWTKYKSPIVVFRDNDTKAVNDNLSQFNFQTVKDSFTAFQDIYTYLGGKASPEKEIPPISNEDKILAKGFDKYSFRKDKSR